MNKEQALHFIISMAISCIFLLLIVPWWRNKNKTARRNAVKKTITVIIFFFWLCLSCSLETDTIKNLTLWCLTSIYLGAYCIANGGLEGEEECY